MIHVRNFVLRAIYSLPPRLRGLPRVSAWLASYVREIQPLEDTAHAIRAGIDPRYADRPRLEKLRILPTTGDDLETYRAACLAEIQIRQSKGRIVDVRNALPGSTVRAIEGGGLRIVSRDPKSPDKADRSASAGVPIELIVTTAAAVGNELIPTSIGGSLPVENCPSYSPAQGYGRASFLGLPR